MATALLMRCSMAELLDVLEEAMLVLEAAAMLQNSSVVEGVATRHS